MTSTDPSKKQLATILSALDDAPRNPANRGEALRAIDRSAQRFGLSTEDVLAAAAGRARWPHEPGRLPGRAARPGQHAGPGHGGATGRPAGAGRRRCGSGAAGADRARTGRRGARSGKRKAKAKGRAKRQAGQSRAGREAHAPHRHQAGAHDRDAQASRGRHGGADRRRHRMAAPHHSRRNLRRAKKKLGLNVEATRTREVGPNKTGAKGSTTVYRIVG